MQFQLQEVPGLRVRQLARKSKNSCHTLKIETTVVTMMIKLLLRGAGVRLGFGRSRIGATFMACAVAFQSLHLTYIVYSLPDFRGRPFYLTVIIRSRYISRVMCYSIIYYWLQKNWKLIKPLISLSLIDELFFCFDASLLLKNTIVVFTRIENSNEIVPSDWVMRVLFYTGETGYAFICIFGIASKLLLNGLLRTALRDVLAITESQLPQENICAGVCRYLSKINALMSVPLMALHVDYFNWSAAYFAANLPALDCSVAEALVLALEALTTTGLLLLIVRPGAMIARSLREVRRRSRENFVKIVPEMSLTKTWGPGCVVVLGGSDLGIVYDGVHSLEWKNAVGFFGLCWSAGFILFQLSLAHAQENFRSFCSCAG